MIEKLSLKNYNKNFRHFLYFLFIISVTTISWGAFGLTRGYHAEQSFYIRSLLTSGVEAFFYPDSSRPFMSTLYHIGFLVTQGSFHGLNLMYGLTIILTGILTVLAGRLIGIKNTFLLVFLYAITLLISADISINVPSMIIVRQSVAASLMALVLSLYSILHSRSKYLLLILQVGVGLSLIFALWSYEASIGFIFGSLVFLLLNYWNSSKIIVTAISYISVIFFFIFSIFLRYIIENNSSYQSEKFAIPSINESTNRYYNYISNLIFPLRWGQYWKNFLTDCMGSFNKLFHFFLILLIILLLLLAFSHLNLLTKKINLDKKYTLKISSILIFIFSAYFPFIFVADASGSWRTHFFSIPIYSILIIWFFQNSINRRSGKSLLMLVSLIFYVSSILYFGTYASLASQLEMNYRWNKTQQFSKTMIERYPNIRDHTLIVLYNYPSTFSSTVCSADVNYDNFGQDYWMTMALRTIYPFSDIRGVYFDQIGNSKTSSELVFEDGYIGFSDSDKRYGFQDILFIEWSKDRFLIKSEIESIPKFLKESIYEGFYNPEALRINVPNYFQLEQNFKINTWVLS